MPERIHLVDASPYIFRAWFSLPESLRDGEGRPVAAVRGWLTTLLSLVRLESPTHLGVAFDESLTTSFRNDFHPGYKASRPLPPPEIEAQLEDCRAVTEALGIPCFVSTRYEADDLIATLVAQLEPEGHEIVVVTSDKDLAQLVSPRVTLFDLARGEHLGPAEVEAKLGVRPERVADLLALAGDPVDDIPGVAGVGRKTAAALLAELSSVEEVYERLDEVASLPLRGARSVRAKLEAGREQAELSKRLALVARDAPVTADLDALRSGPPDPELLEPLLERLRLRDLAGRIEERLG